MSATHGGITMAGRAQHQLVRELGTLAPRPMTWMERAKVAVLRQLLAKNQQLRDDVAYMLRCGTAGCLQLESALSAAKYSMPTGIAPEIRARIQGMLADSFPVELLPRYFGGEVSALGVVSRRLVTTAGVNFLVDAFQNTVEVENLKFHGYGTGTTAEATGDTALVTELTTQYASDSTRPTGTTTEGASANIYRTVATLSPDSGGTIAITEHGVFSQAATGGGTLWDRSVFSAINVVAAADSLQTTYDMTASAGG